MNATAIPADAAAEPKGNGSMGLRGLFAAVNNTTAMAVVCVALFLSGFGAWMMHKDAMQAMERMNRQNLESMGKVVDRNTAALDALAKEIHALRTGGLGPD